MYITGHSMGGSLATLCAYELAVRTPPGSMSLIGHHLMHRRGTGHADRVRDRECSWAPHGWLEQQKAYWRRTMYCVAGDAPQMMCTLQKYG